MKHVLTFLALMIFQYLLFAFVNLNMNAGEWTQGARAFYAFVSPFLSVATMLCIEIIKEK